MESNLLRENRLPGDDRPVVDIVDAVAFPPGYPPSFISRQLDLEYFFECTLRNVSAAPAHCVSTVASHGRMGRAYREHGALPPGEALARIGILVDENRVAVRYESASGERYESSRRLIFISDDDIQLGELEVGSLP